MPSPHVSPGDGSDVSSWDVSGGAGIGIGARYDAYGRRRASVQPTAPTKAAGAGAGTSPTITVAGTDEHFQVTVVAGSSPAAGTLATVTFNEAYASTPRAVFVSAHDAASAALLPYASATTSALTLGVQAAPTASATYIFNVLVVGGA